MSGFQENEVVTLTSDFGVRDGYVGAMKGVMLGIAPGLTLVDIAHDMPPHSISQGALALQAAAPHFPLGTVHLAVVDPGVGTARRAIVITAGGHAFVGPDNGLMLPAAEVLGGVTSCHEITGHRFLPEQRSATFHGRDVFAPTAAAIACGALTLDELGAEVEPRASSLAEPTLLGDGGVVASVVAVDRFGNLVTNVTETYLYNLGSRPRLELPDGTSLQIRRTYGDVAVGDVLALVGSSGALEVAVREGSQPSLAARARARAFLR